MSGLAESRTGLEFIEVVLRYFVATAGPLDADTVRAALTGAFREKGGEIMSTLAQEWIEQGRRQGVEQGLEQGVCQGLLRGIELALKLRFGTEGLRIFPEISKITDSAVLEAVHAAIEAVKSPEELRRIYEQA